MFNIKHLKLLTVLSLASLLLLGCNTYVDSGKVSKSTVNGYTQYSNKTINAEVLTPNGWSTKVTIGGEYVMTSSNEKITPERRPAIHISSSPVDRLSKTGVASSMDGTSETYKKSRLSPSITLEAFKNNKLAFITEENIGPKLRVSTKKSRLAKHDAYEISYSYKVKELPQRLMVKETFTLVDGKVYRVTYYADENLYADYLKELQVVKNSYRILK